ncbi:MULTISPECIES: hypothetical protein [unclassified Paraflavitalea]|uniref:hypothetical protein n=1 Tax=unclassified Paraflavitalea TaxID=2798305 RepID=UPI003D33980A
MFGFFKKSTSIDIEIKLLSSLVNILPVKYSELAKQIDGDLFKEKYHQMKPVRNYVGFIYKPGKSKLFENRKKRSAILRGMQVFNIAENNFADIEIYLSGGLIAGYATPNTSRFIPDSNNVRMKLFHCEYMDDLDTQEMGFFSAEELAFINPSDIYEVELNGKLYYHIFDFEDGDFIGVDREKRVYKVTHDPYEITLINGELLLFLKSFHSK